MFSIEGTDTPGGNPIGGCTGGIFIREGIGPGGKLGGGLFCINDAEGRLIFVITLTEFIGTGEDVVGVAEENLDCFL